MSQVDIIYSGLGNAGGRVVGFRALAMLAVLYVTIWYGFWYAGKRKPITAR
jgi:hypothetical protein